MPGSDAGVATAVAVDFLRRTVFAGCFGRGCADALTFGVVSTRTAVGWAFAASMPASPIVAEVESPTNNTREPAAACVRRP